MLSVTKPGHFELANGGTLFLDEIGEMMLPLQVKLLHAIQDNEIQPVGGRNKVKVDVRIIAATNKNLPEEIEDGGFGKTSTTDWQKKKCTSLPLRQRGKDVVLIAQDLLSRSTPVNTAHDRRQTISHNPSLARECSEAAARRWPRKQTRNRYLDKCRAPPGSAMSNNGLQDAPVASTSRTDPKNTESVMPLNPDQLRLLGYASQSARHVGVDGSLWEENTKPIFV